jgi:hypothetical protein
MRNATTINHGLNTWSRAIKSPIEAGTDRKLNSNHHEVIDEVIDRHRYGQNRLLAIARLLSCAKSFRTRWYSKFSRQYWNPLKTATGTRFLAHRIVFWSYIEVNAVPTADAGDRDVFP